MNCIYCNDKEGNTRDHVPPKAILRRPFPPNLWTVPCCEECNASFTLDEEYFRNMVIGMFCHTPEASQLFDGPVSRAFERRNHQEDVFWKTLDVDNGRPFVEIDQERLDRVARKIIKGLHFVVNQTLITEANHILSFCEIEDSQEIPDSLEVVKFDDSFAPDFTFRNNALDWQLVFFESFQCLAKIEI